MTSQVTPNESLRFERKRRGWTQEEVAKRLQQLDPEGVGVDLNTISRWERGTQIPSPRYVRLLCQLFQLDATILGLVVMPDSTVRTDPVPVRHATPEQPDAHKILVLPPRTRSFIRREAELQALFALLRDPDEVGLAAAIAGMGGIGKTSLALQVAHQLAHDLAVFPGGILWISAFNCHDLAGLVGVYHALFLGWGIDRDPAILTKAISPKAEADLLEGTLREQLRPGGRTLIILDNVEPNFPLSRALAVLMAQGLTVLLTTRALFDLPVLTVWRLDVLPEEEATHLFAARFIAKGGRWREERDQKATVDIVKALGGLPLAIDLAAARAARLGQSPSMLAAVLQQPGILALLRSPTDQAESVPYILAHTLEILSLEERIAFALLSVFEATALPYALIADVYTRLAAGAPDPVRVAEATLEMLITLSLLTSLAKEEATGHVLRLHPLLRELAAERWRAMKAEIQAQGVRAVVAAATAFAQAHAQDFPQIAP